MQLNTRVKDIQLFHQIYYLGTINSVIIISAFLVLVGIAFKILATKHEVFTQDMG